MYVLRKVLSFFISQMAYKVVFGQIRKKALLTYLKALQAARKSLIAAVLIFCVLQVMILGLIGGIVVTVWLTPTELESKLCILLAVFGALFLIPLLGLWIFFSERTWLKASGAVQMLASQNEN